MAGPGRALRALCPSLTPNTSRSFSTSSCRAASNNSTSTPQALFDMFSKPNTTARPPAPRAPAGNPGSSRDSDAFLKALRSSQPPRRQAGPGSRGNAQATQLEQARLLEMQRTVKRRWQGGDIYAPHDLSAAEARKWRKAMSPSSDVFDQLAINPLEEWKNPVMMYEFSTAFGKIRPRTQTGLRPVNQRRISRAIKRAIGMGFMPSVHAHPEILRRKGVGRK